MPKNPSGPPSQAHERIRRLRERIVGFELVCSGNLLRRTKVCGKPTCRCAFDQGERHGPYWEWTRREGGRLVHSIVSPKQAKALARAIRSGRAIHRLLALWERESIHILRAAADTSTENDST